MTSRAGQHRRVVALFADAARGPASGSINGPGPRALDPTEPRPQFVRDLRAQLIAQAAASLPRPARGTVIPLRPGTSAYGHKPGRARGYRLGAAAAALVIGLGSLGLLTHHGPPDALSPANRGLAHTPPAPDHNPTQADTEVDTEAGAEDGVVDLERARQHLHHAQALVTNRDTNDAAQLSQALRDFTRHAEHGAHTLLNPSPASTDDSVDQVSAFTRTTTTTHRGPATTPAGPAPPGHVTPNQLQQAARPALSPADTPARSPALPRRVLHHARTLPPPAARPHRTAPPAAATGNGTKHAPRAQASQARPPRTQAILQRRQPAKPQRLLTALNNRRTHSDPGHPRKPTQGGASRARPGTPAPPAADSKK